MPSEIFDAACEYAQLGLSLVPLHRTNNHSAIRYKHRGGLQADEYRQWFGDGEYNIGILTGDNSAGLMVLDLDDYNALRDFQDRHPTLAKSLPCAASAYGWHFYFHAPAGDRATTSYYVGGNKEFPIAHIKGNGHHVTAAPSHRVTKKGHHVKYSWNKKLPSNLARLPTIEPRILLPYQHLPIPLELALPLPVYAGLPGRSSPQTLGLRPIGPTLTGGANGGDIWLAAHAAAVRYQPTGPGNRDASRFALLRCLKGLFGDTVTVDELRPVFNTWHAGLQAKSYVEDKDYQSNWRGFKDGWKRVKLDNHAAFQVLTVGYNPPEGANGKARLWELCLTLAAWDPERKFYLAGDIAGKFIGVATRTASKFFSELCSEGRLKVVARHNLYRRIATTYQITEGY